tara:strand:- start:133 stop:330 length:198 start_codon:yes stop_codon:yes gene_type:complete
MKNEELEKLIKKLDSKIDKILDDLYYEEDKLIESTSEGFIAMDGKSYDKICEYLKQKDIYLMGIT